jgi:hypothetical protein
LKITMRLIAPITSQTPPHIKPLRGVMRKRGLHPGSPIQTSTNGITGCLWRDNLS